ncbi:MAG: Ig-like domain-containing protein [Flavobacteriales bacterium]|nr:Ig-like domain-containing protein [Flavobacteriales bacterium]
MIASGVFQDLAGNNYVGISNSSTWNFTTINSDVTPPSANTFTPSNNSTGASITNNLVLVFSEPIQLISSAVLKDYNTNNVIPSVSTVSGSTLTINPSSTLLNNTHYYVTIANGAIQDLADNDYAGFPGNATWNFTTIPVADVTPPTASIFVPLDNATGVSVSNDLTLTFSENITVTGGAVLKNFAGTTFPSISTVSGNTLTINPFSNLLNSTQYYVEIANGVVKDLAGNSYAGFSGNSTWNFTTAAGADITNPTAVTYTPINNTSGASLINGFTVVFSENIQMITSPVVKLFSTNVVVPSTSSVSGNTLTINPNSTLMGSTLYYVEIPTGSIQDLAGNNFIGYTGNSGWKFQTEAGDITAPSPVTFVPTDNATGVSLSNNLTLTFDENIQLTGSIILKQFGGAIIPSSTTVSGNTLTINPTSNLADETQFYVEIANGVVQDLVGNNYTGFTGSSVWNFMTLDNTVPTPTAYVPTDNAIGVSISNNLTLTFDEVIQLGTGSAVLKDMSGAIIPSISTVFSLNLTINPTSNLLNNTQYYVELANGVIKDLAGNHYAGFSGNSAWNFTTVAVADVIAPSPVTFVPADNATGVSVSNNLTITFDETIQLTGNAVLKNFAGSVIPSSSSVSGSILTINPTANLANGTQYYVELASGVIKDIANNNYTGFNGNTTWNFTTETAFSIVSISPADNATGITIDQAFIITFNEPILEVNTGSLRMYDAGTNVQLGVNFFLPNLVTISGNSATVTYPTGFISAGQSVYFVLTGATITNMSGVQWSGFAANDYTLHFAVGDITAPIAQIFVPADNATGVSISNDLTITFDEAIQLTGSAVLKDFSGAIIPSSSTVSGSVLTINPTASLVNGTQFYVELANGVIQDLAGNNHTGFSGNTTWNFVTIAAVDVILPLVNTYLPLDNATGVAINSSIELTFNEAIEIAVSGATKLALIRRADGSTFEAITLTSANFSGNTLTIPHTDLEPGVGYYITIANGVVADLAGNWFVGISNNTTWNFIAAGVVVLPIASSYLPLDNATGVAVTSSIELTFNVNIQIAVSGATKVVVIKRADGSIFETVTLTSANISGNTLTIPHVDLENGVSYYINIANGVIADMSVNWFAGIFDATTWNFTTVAAVDVTAPIAQIFVPADNATGVSISNDLTITFDEAIQLTGSVVLKDFGGTIISSSSTVSGSVLTINPTSNLTNSTQYYVEIANGVVQDLVGNDYAGFTGSTTWNFTTEVITSIANISSNVINTILYPNPTKGNFTIDLGVNYEEVEVIIMNIKGQIVSQSGYNQLQIVDLEIEASKGMYFVRILTTDAQEIIKLIKE